MRLKLLAATLISLPFCYHYNVAQAQSFLTDTMDSTTSIGKNNVLLDQKNDKLRFGGYLQPQFQWAESKGAKSFDGGDFSPNSDNRFMLRRGRLRIDYAHYSADGLPRAFIVFQFDGTERGVFIRDFFGRFYENKYQLFSLTMGMFARPMGYEVNLTSFDRESPERGRMSQTLMKTERDIGAMVTFEPRKKTSNFRWLKIDLGLFNGQGLSGTTDYDSHKDVIGRIAMKPQKLNKKGWTLAAATSFYYGGITSQSPIIYKVDGSGNNAFFRRDSSAANNGSITPRHYYGGDVQFKIPNRKGYTEFRAEYMRGQQTATAATSETPGSYPVDATNQPTPLYTRNFDGAYIYFLQHLGTDKLQLVLKYDWYDPNKKVKGNEIDPAKGFTAADIRYDTYGAGFVYYINAHVKATVYYDWVKNEATKIPGFTSDVKDNVLTCRLQFRF